MQKSNILPTINSRAAVYKKLLDYSEGSKVSEHVYNYLDDAHDLTYLNKVSEEFNTILESIAELEAKIRYDIVTLNN